MRISRRDFLEMTSIAGASLGFGVTLTACGPKAVPRPLGFVPERAGKPLSILILGGTAFLGPACVEAAKVRGHQLTLFNRGRTNPQLFPELEKLKGDRAGDLTALEGRRWDAVIDTSGYVPRHVRNSCELLAPNVSHYVFVSTISVFRDFSKPGMDESAPVGVLDDPTTEKVTGETYGPLKALCEQAAEAVMPGRVTNIRPGLIVGRRDRSDRFTYWPVRVARGGEVLAPGAPGDKIQFIDVRDLAEFIIYSLETRLAGVYNATSAPAAYTIGGLLDGCLGVTASGATFTWCDAGFLEEHRVAGWSDMPCWLPPEGEYAGFGEVSTAKAQAAGLGRRSLEDTVTDTLEWWSAQPAERREHLRSGISLAREAEVLAAWHARG